MVTYFTPAWQVKMRCLQALHLLDRIPRMTEIFPEKYTTDNTIVTAYKESYSRGGNGPIWRYSYCPIIKGTQYGLGGLGVLFNTQILTAEIEDFEIWTCGPAIARERRGLGTLLMRSCVAHLKEMNCTSIFSDDVNEKALRVRQRLFPDAAMRFTDPDNPHIDGVPITTAQAIASADKIAEHNERILDKGSENLLTSLGVELDLSLVDTSGWPIAVDSSAYLATVR